MHGSARSARALSTFSNSIRPCLKQKKLRSHAHLSAIASTTPSSVNKDEIEFFSRLSSQWWDESGEFGMLHKMNSVRVKFVRNKLLEIAGDEGRDAELEKNARSGKTLAGLDVLDIGCGGGLLSESLARLGARTLGIDASSSNIGIATAHASQDPVSRGPSSSLTYRNAPAEVLVEEPKRFDLVCSMEVLEHVDNPAAFIRSCAELVKPGGHLFLSTISRTPLAYLLTIFAAEKLLRLVSENTHTYSKFVKPSELVNFFQKPVCSMGKPWISRLYNGIPTRKEAEVRGMLYVPWKGEWRLAPRNAIGSSDCNYMFWARKPVGDIP